MKAFPPRQAIEGIRSLERFYALAAAGQVSVEEFDRLHSMALQSLSQIAEIARSYSISSEQESAIRESISRIEGMTVPMAPEGAAGGTPWWYWLLAILAGAGAGAGLVAAFSQCPTRLGEEMGRTNAFHSPSDALAMVATMAGGSVVGLTGHAYKDTALGALALGAGSSVIGVSLTLLLKELLGRPRLAA